MEGTYWKNRQLVAFSNQKTSAQTPLRVASTPTGLAIGNQLAGTEFTASNINRLRGELCRRSFAAEEPHAE